MQVLQNLETMGVTEHGIVEVLDVVSPQDLLREDLSARDAQRRC